MATAPQQAALDWKPAVVVLFCAGVLALPLAVRGASCGHDFDFHLESWMDAAQSWRAGVVYPHWAASANYGAGEPRFVFYPPLSWMLGAALGLVLGWHAAPVVLTWIALAAAGLSMYRLAREWSDTGASALGACIYIANPYAMFVAYERGAYGELLAAVWLPLILLFALGRRRSIAGLALAVAAVWLTNAPTAVMACYMLAAVILIECLQAQRWWPLVPAAAGTVLGCGLAAFYIVPAAYERGWVEIERAIGPGMRVEDSFLFGRTGEPFHDQVLRTASWITVFFFVTIVVTFFMAGGRSGRRRLVYSLGAGAALVFFLLLPWSSFLWRIAPELRFLQFPWRWLLVCELILALLIALAVSPSPKASPKPKWTLAISASAALTLAMALLAASVFWQICDEEDNISAQLATFHAGAGFEGTDEYTPSGADNSIIQRGLPRVRVLASPDTDEAPSSGDPALQNLQYAPSDSVLPAEITIRSWLPERASVEVRSSSPAFAVLKLMDYPGWRVRVNGQKLRDRLHREDGLLVVPIPSGTSRVEVSYEAMKDAWAGRIISVACSFLWLGTALGRRNPIRLS